ncbi:TetR/AcrR family transcriptional regulator [Periweissella cryptocerci]|uniref:TetR/AcrR family transcriptional regulator n=1 Tax=Periweissella cryptocerci TaxID=2506420 RepID=A0A4P6YTY0_9LACO|nr:TetR/AcrR family transcriptional regulator [Periweissella cryptocerci]QBO36224.1 TetR/AcrR family transcriptional regulator [Periweissella cryptocerci]
MASEVNGTQAYLLGAIERLLKKKSFEDISVSELTRVAGISRMTFYRHYQNITDVLTTEMNKLVGELEQDENLQTTDFYAAIVYYMHFLSDHADFINLLLRANQQTVLRDNIAKVLAVLSSNKPQLKNFNEREMQYYVKYHATGLTSVIVEWIERNQPETPEELATFLEKNTDGVG